MRQALERSPGEPLKVEDDEAHKVYFLIDGERAGHLFDQWLKRELEVGLDQADRGKSKPLDITETLAEAHRRHARKHE